MRNAGASTLKPVSSCLDIFMKYIIIAVAAMVTTQSSMSAFPSHVFECKNFDKSAEWAACYSGLMDFKCRPEFDVFLAKKEPSKFGIVYYIGVKYSPDGVESSQGHVNHKKPFTRKFVCELTKEKKVWDFRSID